MKNLGSKHMRLASRGFTLLEIMMSLAIISIAMVSLLSLANRTIGVHEHLQSLTAGTLLAQQKMAETEVSALRGTLDSLGTEGGFAEPYADYTWRITYTATPLPSVRMVTVTVAWGDEAENEQIDLTSFIF